MNEERLWQLFTMMHDQTPASTGGVHLRVQLAYKMLQEYEREVAFLKTKEETQAEIDVLMIDDLDLPCRVLNYLRFEDIRTIDQLCSMTENRVLRIPSLGRKALSYIKDELHKHGRELAKK